MFSQSSSSHTFLQQSRYTEDDRRSQLEHFLESKVNEISQLRQCFHHVADELKHHQQKQSNIRSVALAVQQLCSIVKDELRGIAEDFAALNKVRCYYETQIRELPYIITQVMIDNRESLCQKFREQTDSLKRKYQFELFRIEEQQKTQIQILKAEHRRELAARGQQFSATVAQLQKMKAMETSKLYQVNDSAWTRGGSVMRDGMGTNSKRANLSFSRDESLFISQQLQCSPVKVPTRNKHSIPRTPSVRKKVLERALGIENTQLDNLDSRLKESIEDSVNSIQERRVGPKSNIPVLPSLKVMLPVKKSTLNGYSSLVIGNREVYRGMWQSGKFHGRGKLTQDHWIYDGEFSNGLPDGLGSLYFQGATYTGRFSQGQASGEGTLAFDNSKVSGLWDRNRLISVL